MQQGNRALEVHAALSGCSKEQSECQLQGDCQRAQLDFHRPTVWRDMVVLERANHGPEVEVVEGRGPSASLKKSNDRTRNAVIIAFAVAVFAALLRADVFKGERSKNTCLAMLVLLSILWSTEAIPLYVTSMLVPALTVLLKIIPAEDGHPMDAPDAAHRVFEVSCAVHRVSVVHWNPFDSKAMYDVPCPFLLLDRPASPPASV